MEFIMEWFSNLIRSIENYFGQYESLGDFFLSNTRNPFLWIGIFIVGLIIYMFVYNALKKEH